MGRPRKQGHLVESQEVVQDIVSLRIQDREHSQCSLNKLTHTTTTNDVLTAVPVLFSSATLHSNQLINSPSCLASPDMSKHTASTSLHERSNSVGQAEFKSNHTAPHPLDLSSVSSAATKDMGITLVAGPNAHRNGTIPHAYIGKKQENLEAKVCETKSRLQGILEYNRRVNEDNASDRVNNISSNGHHCEQLEVIETKNPKVCGIPSTENNSISKKEYEISDYVSILTYINEYREEIKQEKVNCENQLENIPLSIVTGSSCTLGKSNNGESSPNSVQKSHTDNPSVHSQVNSGDDPKKHMLKLMNMYANDEWIKLSNYGYFEKNIEVKKKCYESEINQYVSNASTQIPYCESAHDSKAGNDPVTYSHDGLSPTLSVTENKSQSQCSGDISCSKSTQKVKERSAKRGCESLSCSEFDESYWFRLKLHVCSERKYSQLHDDVKQMARQCYERILYDTDEVQNPDYSGIIDEKPEWPGSKENLPGFLKFVKKRLVRLTHSVVTYLSSMPGNSHPTVGDRISLCRLGYFNVMLLISATDRYVPKERTFKYFFDIPIPPTGYMYSLREELLSFGERVQLLQLDEFEKAFLIAVVFFAPDWSNLEDKERVANIHNIYMEAFMLHMVKNNRDEEFFEHLVLTIIKSRELSMWFAQCVDRMPLELDEEELEDTCSRYR